LSRAWAELVEGVAGAELDEAAAVGAALVPVPVTTWPIVLAGPALGAVTPGAVEVAVVVLELGVEVVPGAAAVVLVLVLVALAA
jgi:hypothetical protein